MNFTYMIQTGKGKGSYVSRYGPFNRLSTAMRWYEGINTHSGYKKRLVVVQTGKVIARTIT